MVNSAEEDLRGHLIIIEMQKKTKTQNNSRGFTCIAGNAILGEMV